LAELMLSGAIERLERIASPEKPYSPERLWQLDGLDED